MEFNEKALSPAPEHGPRQEMKREVVELAKMVLLFLVLFWSLKTFVVEGYEVQGPSMIPALEDHDRILVFKLAHQLRQLPFFSGLNALEEGDIVVFESSVEPNKRYIKRVIAKGPPLLRNQVDAQQRDELAEQEEGVKVEFVNGTVFVGDQPLDEGYIAPEERHSPDHAGPVYLHAGEYYVLGDHRSVSKDSRSFRAIHEEQIVGRAMLRFWPLNRLSLL